MGATDVLVTRRPIFTAPGRIYGFDLVWGAADRSGGETSDRLLVDTFLGLGVERVTQGRPAFLRVSRSMLVSRAVELFDPRGIIVELGPDITPEEPVLAACEALVAAGFRMALADAPDEARTAALLPLAAVVRVEVDGLDDEGIRERARRVAGGERRLLASGVAGAAARAHCRQLGFTLFAGDHFSRGQTVVSRDLPVAHLRTFRLMRDVRDPDVSTRQLEEAFRSDVTLCFKLLRMVRSAAIGARSVESITHAIHLLGRAALYRWLSLLLLSSIAPSGPDEHLVQRSLVRGRLCELLALRLGRAEAADSLYLLGMLSLLDRLLQAPMEEVLPHLALSDELAAALRGDDSWQGLVLRAATCYEAGVWDEMAEACERLELPAEEILQRYLEALAWAESRVSALVDR